MSNLRILIADDHDLLRRGVKSLLESHAGWTVCAEARTGLEAVAHAEEKRPDIAILDITMPDLNGIEAGRRIRKSCPKTEVLLLSVHHSDQLIREIFESGIRGFILKSDSDRDLVAAVEVLSNHRPWITPCATELLLSGKGGVNEKLERLTSREREIVQLLAESKTSKEIASKLGISTKTAETHRANIMRKLEIHSISDLVRYAVRNQIIEP
ncbi:MAG TPA: response regulator transcription factor [Candidatus Acidoferrales bacterium]|nr:response regulator transcription factor [Candidatus Acidoferrales bacterium]